MTFEKVRDILRYRKIKKAQFEVIEEILNAHFERLNPNADYDHLQFSLEDNKIKAIQFAARFNGQPDPFIKKAKVIEAPIIVEKKVEKIEAPTLILSEIQMVKSWIEYLEMSTGKTYSKNQVKRFVENLYHVEDAKKVLRELMVG